MSVGTARPDGGLIDPFKQSEGDRKRESARPFLAAALQTAGWIPPVLAFVAAALACAASLWVFPLLSENNDEAIYLLQADALRHGRLFPPAPENWRAFLPALSVFREGSYVPKYTPVHAAIIAIGQVLTGSPRGALVIIAALAAATSYLLARQILGPGRPALMATAFFVLSPVTVIQSGTYLSYLSALALLQGFGAALVSGVRSESRQMLCLSGFLLGTAVFARPYEAVLFGAPFAGWLLWTHRRAFRRVALLGGWLGLGALLPLFAMFAYFHESTGSWTRSPFTLLHASDTVGFGSRQMYPTSRATLYTPQLAWIGLRDHLRLLSFWAFGGLGLAGLAVAGALKMKWSQPGRWLGLILITVPLGYFFFWGSFGAIRWGVPRRLGPFYYLPMLTPLTILAAGGLDRMWAGRRRRLAMALLVAMVAFSAGRFATVVRANGDALEPRRLLYGPLLTCGLQNAIVFLPSVTGSSLLTHPFALARNDARFSGEILWALDRGRKANRDILTAFSGRIPYILRFEGHWRPHGRGHFSDDFRTYLESFSGTQECRNGSYQNVSTLRPARR